MRDKVVDYIMLKIKNKSDYDKTKLLEIRYGLQGLYSLLTKTIVIIAISVLLNIFSQIIIFFAFYIPLRSFGFGVHAKSNIQCWILSVLLILALPYLFTYINFTKFTLFIIWCICFINFWFFSPSDTDKRPIKNKKRRLKLKISVLILSIIYLFLFIKFDSIAGLIIAAMILQSFLVNPISYLIMGQKIRFRLNDINIFKLN